MDKHKLIQIVQKDLDELKSLTEEVAAFEQDATLIIDLTLSKARLLCQEIELLHEYAAPPKTETENIIGISAGEEENEDEDLSISDPELEIINFEQPDTTEEEEESTDYSEDEEEEEELADEEKDFALEEPLAFEEEEESDLSDFVDEDEEPENEEILEPETEEQTGIEDDQAEEDSVVYSEDEESEDEDIEVEIVNEESEEDVVYNSDEDEEEELIEEESDLDEDLIDSNDEEDEEEPEVHVNDLSHDSQSGVREIYIDDLDDDDLDNFKIAPANETSGKPVMREIPKPEEPLQEEAVKDKQIIGEKFSKERSLNDAIGESKSGESKLSNGPISSLKAAIGINDRFLFIREIFNNNNEKYNTVIDQLDKLETIQEAVDYLKVNLTLQKNDTSLKFVDLLKRRFSK